MLDDQHMGCREENFIVFMYALRSMVRPWSGLRNSRDQTIHTFLHLFLTGFVYSFILLNPSVVCAEEHDENSVFSKKVVLAGTRSLGAYRRLLLLVLVE